LFPAAIVLQVRPLASRQSHQMALPSGTEYSAQLRGAPSPDHADLGASSATVASVRGDGASSRIVQFEFRGAGAGAGGSSEGANSGSLRAAISDSECSSGELLLRVAVEEGESAALELLCDAADGAGRGGLLVECGSMWALRRRRRVLPLLGRLLRRARARDVKAVLRGGLGVNAGATSGAGTSMSNPNAAMESAVVRSIGDVLDALLVGDGASHALSAAVVDASLWAAQPNTDSESKQGQRDVLASIDLVVARARRGAAAALEDAREATMAAVGYEAAVGLARREKASQGSAAGAALPSIREAMRLGAASGRLSPQDIRRCIPSADGIACLRRSAGLAASLARHASAHGHVAGDAVDPSGPGNDESESEPRFVGVSGSGDGSPHKGKHSGRPGAAAGQLVRWVLMRLGAAATAAGEAAVAAGLRARRGVRVGGQWLRPSETLGRGNTSAGRAAEAEVAASAQWHAVAEQAAGALREMVLATGAVLPWGASLVPRAVAVSAA